MLAVFDQGLVSATSFATVILLGRFGSPEQLGIYYLALTVLQVIFNFQAELITAPYTVFCHQRKARDLAEYTGSIIAHQVALTLLALVALAGLAAAAYAGWASSALCAPLLVLLVAGPCWLLRSFVRYLCFARLHFVAAALLDGATGTLQLMGLLALCIGVGMTAAGAYVVVGIACALPLAAWWWQKRIDVAFAPQRFWPDWRDNWTFSRWSLASQLVGTLPAQVLPWFLAQTHGVAVTGVFAACASLTGIAMMFVLGIANALTPQAAQAFSAGGVPALRRVMRRTAQVFAVTVGLFCVVIAFGGEFVMQLFYGSRYGGVHLAFTLLSCGVLTNSLAIVAGNGLWAVNRPRANLIADLCILLVTVSAAFFLVGRWGITGAAAATLLGSTTGMIARTLIARRILAQLASPANSP
jgi:O-antigen/teichoic acid export membrane protein